MLLMSVAHDIFSCPQPGQIQAHWQCAYTRTDNLFYSLNGHRPTRRDSSKDNVETPNIGAEQNGKGSRKKALPAHMGPSADRSEIMKLKRKCSSPDLPATSQDLFRE